jgi:hypothetical protein
VNYSKVIARILRICVLPFVRTRSLAKSENDDAVRYCFDVRRSLKNLPRKL